MSTQDGRGKIQTSDLRFMRCSPQPIELPAKLINMYNNKSHNSLLFFFFFFFKIWKASEITSELQHHCTHLMIENIIIFNIVVIVIAIITFDYKLLAVKLVTTGLNEKNLLPGLIWLETLYSL
jgi:hypothetical protein